MSTDEKSKAWHRAEVTYYRHLRALLEFFTVGE